MPGLGKFLSESCRQQASCQLSMEAPGAALGLWLGLPLSPLWAPDLDGQQALRPRLSANSNRLLAGPGKGASAEKAACSSSAPPRGREGGPRQDALLLGDVPWSLLVSSSRASHPQKYNADYDLSARQGADTLAFMSLLEEKLLPVLVSAPRPPSICGQ